MTWVAVAVGGAALVGGVVASQGAQSAADTQAGAAMNAAQIGQNEFNTITQQEQPFMQGGYGALSQLDYLLGIPSSAPTSQPSSPYLTGGGFPTVPGGMGAGGYGAFSGYDPSSGYQIGAGGAMTRLIPGGSTPPAGSASTTPSSTAGGFGSLLAPFTADTFKQYSPAYQFQMQQGGQGVLNADASGAGALSGAAQKDLIGYNQNMANTAFNNAFNQYQVQQGNIYSRLAGIAQLGQAAAANTGQQGTALAGNVAQSVTNAGTAQAAGQVGAANAWSGALSSAAPWLAYGGGGSASGGGAYSVSPDQYLAATGG
jgi:hypothetical protein